MAVEVSVKDRWRTLLKPSRDGVQLIRGFHFHIRSQASCMLSVSHLTMKLVSLEYSLFVSSLIGKILSMKKTSNLK